MIFFIICLKKLILCKGQDILLDEFQKGAYAILITEGMEGNDLNQLEDKIVDIDGVAKLISYNHLAGHFH